MPFFSQMVWRKFWNISAEKQDLKLNRTRHTSKQVCQKVSIFYFYKKTKQLNELLNMKKKEFEKRVTQLFSDYNKLINRTNKPLKRGNGIFIRYKYPILTAEHTPVFWRYDLNPKTNPYLMTRLGINSVFNSGAIMFKGKYTLVARVEGWDRKSFFAVAQSPNGIDHWEFWDYPVTLPETKEPDTNVYDMRLTQHEDGWILRIILCREERPQCPSGRYIIGSCSLWYCPHKDLVTWEKTSLSQKQFMSAKELCSSP
jgi:4-O-beta-D-mannosyl-D-glucose phosphorylase